MNRLFFLLYVLIGNDFAGLLPPDKEVEKADTWCPKPHSLELSKDMSCSKIPVVARVIASDFGARSILGEFLYVFYNLQRSKNSPLSLRLPLRLVCIAITIGINLQLRVFIALRVPLCLRRWRIDGLPF